MRADRPTIPAMIRNLPVIRRGPIAEFDSVISTVVDSGQLQEIRMRKLETSPIELIQGP